MSIDSMFPTFHQRLLAEVAEGSLTLGVQACIRYEGVTVELAAGDDGLGRPMREETIFRLYSTGKPYLALCIARLLDRGLLSFDQPIVELVDGLANVAGLGPVEVRHLLQHTAGVHVLSGVWFTMLSDSQRRALSLAADPPVGWRVGVDAGYSEFVAWHLLSYAIEGVVGAPYPEVLVTEVLEPLGLANTALAMSRAEYYNRRTEIGVNLDMVAEAPVPMLGEASFIGCSSMNPAYCVYGNARDLVHAYAAVVDAQRGATEFLRVETARRLTMDRRGVRHDHTFDRDLDYALGFMVGLDLWRYGSHPSPDAFGHSGLFGTTMAFADPAHDVACAVLFNGLIDSDTSLDYRRPAIVNALYSDIANLEGGAVAPNLGA